MLHGNLKLSNVMLDASYSARLGDYGFNRLKAETGMTLPVVPHVRAAADAAAAAARSCALCCCCGLAAVVCAAVAVAVATAAGSRG